MVQYNLPPLSPGYFYQQSAMTTSKAALKEVRETLEAGKYGPAAVRALELIQKDPNNYYLKVFFGVANEKLNQLQDAETAFNQATNLNPSDPLAWQGLITLYDRWTGGKKLDQFRHAVLQLGQIYQERNLPDRCQDIVNRYTKAAQKSGTPLQYKQSLELQIPSSPLYEFLEGRLPRPSQTYSRLVDITEVEEKEWINREIGERRTRLGAKLDEVTIEVKKEASKKFQLDQLYNELISWSNDDVVRRECEEKLLVRAYEGLAFFSGKQKDKQRRNVEKAAKDMVIIKHPFQLAWDIFLEWQDIEEYSQYDVGVLRQYIEFFESGDSGLAKILKAFLASGLSPFPPDEKAADDDEASAKDPENSESSDGDPVTADELLLLMVEGFEKAPSSIIAHRITADFYFSIDEYSTAIETARKGQVCTSAVVNYTGGLLQNHDDALCTTLANSLIHYQAPRYHLEAKKLFEDILKRKPSSTTCLLGVGLVLEIDEQYENAADFFQRACERDPSNIKIRGELAWCNAKAGDMEAGLKALQDVLARVIEEQPDNKPLKSELLYRIGHCQWELDPSPAVRKDRKGAFANFLASITANLNYAPAYTSLGIYYSDYKGDKVRARKCFHKAFELSSSEIEAAERLAKGFADLKEWEIVEAVAQRVIDSGKVQPSPGSKRKGFSWPFAALGTVQINKQQYAQSTVSFQNALRVSGDDYYAWVGLAESYHHSGRYIAATKAFEYLQTLESKLSSEDRENVWFVHYMQANVKRELGDYTDAIDNYRDILATRAGDLGVSVTLLQTLVENSWRCLRSGLFNEAAEQSIKALELSSSIVETRADISNMWKSVGDACANFSYIKKKTGLLSFSKCKALITTQLDPVALDLLSEVDGVGNSWLYENEDSHSSDFCVYMSILAYKRAIDASINDPYSQAIGWYNLGWAEYRAYRHSSKGKKPRKFLMAAMRCFKRAIELEAGNSEFWNSLAVATTELNPEVAQHAFVRSLHLNEKNARAWCNLGTFYLIHKEIQLANEAFMRAQSIDPDYPQAWIGQGFVALNYLDTAEARSVFEHAYEISGSTAVLAKRQYTLSLFDQLQSGPASHEVSELIQPFFALHQLCIQDPSDLTFTHLSALLAERMGETADAEASLEVVCAGMEAEYEESESAASLEKYAQANADMARVLLANCEYEKAIEKAELALSLSGEEDAGQFDAETCSKLRLSACLTAGLAYYYTKSMDNAIDMFRDAIQDSNHDPNAVCLLAQVLWAKGGEEERSVARQQLLDCIEAHPDHVGAVTLLGTIALLDKDKDAIDAVGSDLYGMITNDNLDLHSRATILKLLAAISMMGFTETDEISNETRLIGEATAAIMLSPDKPQGWMELSAVSGSSYAAEMAVSRSLRSVPPHGNLTADDLSKAYAQTGMTGDAFVSIMVAPWCREGWDALTDSLGNTAD
ncbi:hypothetical protein N7495_009785 [Penicillium taxi]|uniref:uncharacterized protein n=1 Tax=Penicillium taxi TaxID=168475 RepID=UPI002545A391|nr:uncharacterized protein N7495_009785 [Penicillium taxi]KAJ5885275.1 hypothetical protein N7495_009785 [Penicillium taxi]